MGGRGGGLLNCFFLSFSNDENICVYSKSKIKTNLIINLEHFKIRNRRLFIPKFCNNSEMLQSFSWAIFVRALVFSFSTSANFSSLEYLFFVSTNFSIHSYLVRKKSRKRIILSYRLRSFNYALLVLIQQITVTFISY